MTSTSVTLIGKWWVLTVQKSQWYLWQKNNLPDTHFPSVAFVQQLDLGILTKRDSNFIHIQYIPFPRVTMTQGKFFRNADRKKVSNICHKLTGGCIFPFLPLMITTGQGSLVFRQKIRPWHRVSLVSLILRNLSLALLCKMQCSSLVRSSWYRRTQGQSACPC